MYIISDVLLWTPHMGEQKQDDQLEHTYSSSVRIRDVALKTCQRQWTIGRSGERGSGISVLAAQHDDDDDDIYIYIYIYIERERDTERIWRKRKRQRIMVVVWVTYTEVWFLNSGENSPKKKKQLQIPAIKIWKNESAYNLIVNKENESMLNAFRWRSFTPLQICSRCILQPLSIGPNIACFTTYVTPSSVLNTTALNSKLTIKH